MTHTSIQIEGDTVTIKLPIKDAHSLRVALAECPCKATKSTSTMDIRQRLRVVLGKVKK